MIGVKANAIPVYRYFTQQKYISFNFVYLYFSICSIQHHKNQKFYFTREAKVYTPPPLGSLQHSFYQISITLRGWWWVMKEDARTDWFWIRAILVGVSWWEKTVVPFHHHQLILISPLFFFFFFASPINGVVLLSIAFAPLLSAVLFPAEVSICHHREWMLREEAQTSEVVYSVVDETINDTSNTNNQETRKQDGGGSSMKNKRVLFQLVAREKPTSFRFTTAPSPLSPLAL